MKRILVLDNYPDIAWSVEMALAKDQKYLVESVPSASSAYDLIRSKQYDLVMIDPSEDQEVLRHKVLSEILAEEFPGTIRVCFTGIGEATDDPLLKERFQYILRKSIYFGNNLLQKIEKIFQEKNGANTDC
jgi:DNA-binding NtrC family response regulator